MATTSPSTSNGALSDSRVEQLTEYVREPVQAFAFWAAIALPFAYLPILTSGFEGGANPIGTFVALVVANVVALVLGHGYGED